MRRSQAPTVHTELTNSVVLVGGDPAFRAMVEGAARSATGAHVFVAELATVMTTATKVLPFAIVAPRELYEFAGPDLEALARDVGAELLVVPPKIAGPILSALVLEAAAARLK